ncbi:hypothetical protein PMIN04_004114 [Paraphaeosphaeria minitans]|uniref:Uncharacterized protein n=1 Tax=Paraphaeosphaeria minitans TaxID=565426 RepID=A0A9P6GJE9_9PLEO|nr:hypothetical protein PMIN01_06098 [Paraphaeosphaeria minitans]
MPSLKDLHCFIELLHGKTRLLEFGTTYGDGCVETFVAVAEQPQAFAISLSSSEFIAPGLAMYVFIDGVYQCNRNRQNLKLRKPPNRESLVNFVVRQKEERQDDGTMIARDWNFEKLDIANEALEACSSKLLDNLGCIEVVVLRCAGIRSAKLATVNVKPMNLDGAGDMPDNHFRHDGARSSYAPQYDDRAWEYLRSGNRHAAPTISSSHLHSGPPPSLSFRSYAARPRHTSPVSQVQPQLPDHMPGRQGLTGSVRYGSGPVPRQIRTASIHGPEPSMQGASASHMPLDPRSLDQVLANIAQRSPDRYYQTSSQGPTVSIGAHNARPSHIPGSWPEPNKSPVSPFVNAVQDPGGLAFPPPTLALGLQSDMQHTQTSWDQRRPESSTGGWNAGNGWESGGEEENISSTWDSGDTWGSPKQGHGRKRFNSEHPHEHMSVGRDSPAAHAPSPAAQTTRTGHWTQSSDFHTARSRSSASAWDTNVNGEGWTHIEASSGSSGSWSLPVHRSESISHIAGPSVVGSAVSPAPLVDALSKKLLDLKVDEEPQRRYAATAPAVSLAPSVPFPGNGFSTFEKSVRNAIANGKDASIWKVDSSEIAPKAWSALENHVMPQNLVNDFPLVGNDYRTVHGDKDWGEPTKDTTESVWTTKETMRPSTGRPSEMHGRNSIPKDKWTTEMDHGGAMEETAWDAPSKPKDLQASDSSWQADINGWSASQKADSMANGRNPWNTTDEAKSRPSKIRLSKYRQLRSEVATKRHRQFPPPTPDKKSGTCSRDYSVDAEPLLKVKKEDAAKKGVEHQVRAGKGLKYGHAIGRPEYLDNLEKPYAVFRFKYRAHSTLLKILGKEIVPSDAALLTTRPGDQLTLARPTTSVEVGDVKQQLKKIPKVVLIDELLDLQTKLEKKMRGPEVAPADTAGMNRTRDWVRQQSRATSVNDKKKAKEENRKGGESWSLDDEWN